jgi:hypothetical protein
MTASQQERAGVAEHLLSVTITGCEQALDDQGRANSPAVKLCSASGLAELECEDAPVGGGIDVRLCALMCGMVWRREVGHRGY